MVLEVEDDLADKLLTEGKLKESEMGWMKP